MHLPESGKQCGFVMDAFCCGYQQCDNAMCNSGSHNMFVCISSVPVSGI